MTNQYNVALIESRCRKTLENSENPARLPSGALGYECNGDVTSATTKAAGCSLMFLQIAIELCVNLVNIGNARRRRYIAKITPPAQSQLKESPGFIDRQP